ncbi:hypothetical protein CVB78_004450 [Escherichia coli]|nr:hypothetical protein [Escherichia coli]
MIDKAVLTRIAKNLSLEDQAELFAADPLLFLTEQELKEVLKAAYIFKHNCDVIRKAPGTDTTPQPTIVNEDDDMDGNPF